MGVLPSPLAGSLLVAGVWLAVAVAGLIPAGNAAIARRFAFPLGALAGVALAVLGLQTVWLPPQTMTLPLGRDWSWPAPSPRPVAGLPTPRPSFRAFRVRREAAATSWSAGSPRASGSSPGPLNGSPATRRMPTNGSKNTAATSQALNVGAQTPMSGENASPTPAVVPLRPLASA